MPGSASDVAMIFAAITVFLSAVCDTDSDGIDLAPYIFSI